MEMKLRPPQERAAQAIEQDFQAGHNRLLLRICTGGGKTAIASAIPRRIGLPKRKLFLAHREELIEQAARTLRRWNPGASVGIEMARQHCSPGDEYVVSSVQTIGRRNSRRIGQLEPADFSYLVIDECQHSVSTTYKAILSHFQVWDRNDILVLGLTATPNRTDGTGLDEIFQKISYDYAILAAIREGYLVDLRGYRIRTATDLYAVRTLAGDFEVGELRRQVNTPARNDLAVRAWIEKGEGRQTVAYCVDIEHAKQMAEAFRRYGIRAEAIWGGDPGRGDRLKRHRSGELKVLANCALLTEGYDDPNIGCVLMARPTQSETLYCQIVGRGTRLPDGVENLLAARQLGAKVLKEDCIVIDLVDNSARHSLVTLSTLFGLSATADLGGQPISGIVRQLDELRTKRPYVDLSRILNFSALEAYSQQVDLFWMKEGPKFFQISDYKWVKLNDEAFGALLGANDQAAVVMDRMGNWHFRAQIRGNEIKEVYHDLGTAINDADTQIRLRGARKPGWSSRGEQPPTPLQLTILRRRNIQVPPDANWVWCHERIKEVLAKSREELQRMLHG